MIRATLAAAPALVLLSGCATVPETGRMQLTLYPEDEMAQLGAQAYQEATTAYPTITGTAAAAMVERVGRAIAQASGRDYDWEFRLLDAPDQVNAFALPGGKVAVFSGLLRVAEDEDGLATVLGHEVAHATSHHGNERMSQGMVTDLALTGVEAALTQWEGASASTRSAIMAALGMGTQVGLALPFSRAHEREADEIGLRFLVRAGFDPQAAPRLWERMAALESNGGPPGWLSTHPAPLDRAEHLRELIPQIVAEESGRLGRSR